MEVRRTVPVKLEVDEDDASLLRETVRQFVWAANYVCEAARDGDYVETDRSVLHEQTYDEVRMQTDLHSNHVQSARDWASQALKSVVSKWKRGKYASLPTLSANRCEYNKRNATFEQNYATLSTVAGRVRVEYVLPSETRETPHSQYLRNGEYETTGATLHERGDDFYLHVRTKADVDHSESHRNRTVLGVDLGVKNLAVTSTGRFWSADELNHWRREYEQRRHSLAQCGSRDAHEALRRVGWVETARLGQMLHAVAKQLVAEAVDHGCSYIAFEDLTRIRERLPEADWHNKWAFRRLFEYVEYKAANCGITVVRVNPAHTSQRCSTCGFVDSTNRQRWDEFHCGECGYRNHADYNAAKNIGFGLLRDQNGIEGGAPVGVRLNTGMLTTNGVTPVPSPA